MAKRSKKKSNTWKLIVSIFFAIGGLGNIGTSWGTAIFGIVVAAAFGFWWWKSRAVPKRGSNTLRKPEPPVSQDTSVWTEQDHLKKGQAERMSRALSQSMEIISHPSKQSAVIKSSEDAGALYTVTPAHCTCEDFKFRKMPCKHMYFYMIQCCGFDPSPYISYGESTKLSVKKFPKSSNLSNLRDYYVIDTETTGLDPNYDRIVEIAILKMHDGTVVDEYCTLVNPEMPIPVSSSKVNHIFDKDVADAPNYPTVARDVANFLSSGTIVGHNVRFDLDFLSQLIYGASTTAVWQYVDTLELSRERFPDAPNHKLQTLVQYLGIKTTGAHRAKADALATAQLFDLCRSE